MPLSDVLSQIPGYAGYNAARLRNLGEEQGNLQQAMTLQAIIAKQQAQQQEAQMQEVVSQAGGDPAKTVEALMRTGHPKAIELATKMKSLMPKQDAQPIGSGGLRLPDGTIVPPAARPEKAAPAEPLHSVVDPNDPKKGILVPRSEAKGKQPFSPSLAGTGTLEPETLTQVAEQYLAGDRQAIQGYARNAQARAALQNEIAKQARAKGWSGADIAAQMADFTGTMAGSRTVGTRAAQISLAATEAEKMIPVAEAASKAFERSQFVPANVALKAFQTQTGKPEVLAFGAALNSLVNVYARAISPSGVPTVSDKDHAREMISTIHSPEQFAAVMGIIRQELKIAKEAPGLVKDATRQRVSPGVATEAPAAAPTSGWSIKPL